MSIPLKIRRLGYALGAEITELDLKKKLDDDVVAEIRNAWLEHIVLCFPGQDLSAKELSVFGRRFGELDDNRLTPHLRHPDDDAAFVLVNKPVTLDARTFTGAVVDVWHSDLAYTDRPSTATLLNGKELPAVGGDTLFANMYRAYETLSPAMQRAIEPLEAVHDVALNAAFKGYSPELQAERRRLCPPVVHPIVRVHPETGRKALYTGERIRNFVGMTAEETKPLLDFLNRHATAYELQYRHRWSADDLLMWDNRCAMHRAAGDFDRSGLRRLMRCSLLAERTGYFADIGEPAVSGASLKESAG